MGGYGWCGSRCVSSLVTVKCVRIGSYQVGESERGEKREEKEKENGRGRGGATARGAGVSDRVPGEATRVADECEHRSVVRFGSEETAERQSGGA